MKGLLIAILGFLFINLVALAPTQTVKLPGATHAVGSIEAITFLDRGNFTKASQISDKEADVTASFFWFGVSLSDDKEFKKAYLRFRERKPNFATDLNAAWALGQIDVPKTAAELLKLLDTTAATNAFEEANQVFHKSKDILSFSPSQLGKKAYRFIYLAIANEVLQDWVKVMRESNVKEHTEYVDAVDTFLKNPAVDYNGQHEKVLALTKKMMDYKN